MKRHPPIIGKKLVPWADRGLYVAAEDMVQPKSSAPADASMERLTKWLYASGFHPIEANPLYVRLFVPNPHAIASEGLRLIERLKNDFGIRSQVSLSGGFEFSGRLSQRPEEIGHRIAGELRLFGIDDSFLLGSSDDAR